jgi:peptidoglycan/LPS O-acetylase OafA/YrhL
VRSRSATDTGSAGTHHYRPELDGLRSIAVYLVLLFHTGLGWAKGGFIGVDLFFVLSGFLVSSVILSEIDRTGTLRVGRFYARRVRRLLPAAVVVVVATSLAFTVLWSVARRLDIVGDAQSALLYYANWHFMQETGDYFAADVDKSPFLHFWSLAIEEQFYVVFPVLLLVLRRLGRRALLLSLTALLALSLLAQLYWAQVDATHAYYGTDTRLYQLIAGAVLAVVLRPWAVAPSGRGGSQALAAGGLLGLIVLGSGLVTVSASVRGIGAAVVSALLIWGLALGPHQPLARLLALRVPVFLGRISYGTYLWHWPVIIALTTLFETSPVVIAAFALAISTGLAALSYEVLEMPVRKAKVLDRVQWRIALVGVGTSAVLAVTLVPGVLELDRKPQLATAFGEQQAATRSAAARRPVPTDVDWEEARTDIGDAHWCPTEDPEACKVREGDGPHVLFVADSQGVTFVPMFKRLARERDLTLSLNVLAGCPWQEGLANANLSAAGARDCEAARVGWYDEALPALDPDVVVLLGRPRDDPAEWEGTVVRRDGRDQPLNQAVFETTNETLERIGAVAEKTVLIERLIMPETFDPVDCLASSETIGQCAVPVPTEPSASDGYFAAAAAQSPSVLSVSLNDVYCPGAPVCLPMVGRHVVWRDNHHYTATYATARRDAVWRTLAEAGAFDGSDG